MKIIPDTVGAFTLVLCLVNEWRFNECEVPLEVRVKSRKNLL